MTEAQQLMGQLFGKDLRPLTDCHLDIQAGMPAKQLIRKWEGHHQAMRLIKFEKGL